MSKSGQYKQSQLPYKFNYSFLRDNIATKRDLNKTINMLNRFSKEGQDKLVSVRTTSGSRTLQGDDQLTNNIQITKWERDTLKSLAKTINNQREKRLKKIESIDMIYKGNKVGYKIGEMGNQELKELRPVKPFFKSMEKFEPHTRLKSFITQSSSKYFSVRDYQLKENIISTIRTEYHRSPMKSKLIKKLEDMSLDKFLDTYYANGGEDFYRDYAYHTEENEEENLDYLCDVFEVEIPDETSSSIVKKELKNKTKSTKRK